jgi:hypothetical protein
LSRLIANVARTFGTPPLALASPLFASTTQSPAATCRHSLLLSTAVLIPEMSETPFKSQEAFACNSTHSPATSLTACGFAITSLISRSPARGATIAREPPSSTQPPPSTGITAASHGEFAAHGVPKFSPSYEFVASHHRDSSEPACGVPLPSNCRA